MQQSLDIYNKKNIRYIKTVHIKVIYKYDNISAITPILLYITWGLVQDLKPKKHRYPKTEKEDPNIYI